MRGDYSIRMVNWRRIFGSLLIWFYGVWGLEVAEGSVLLVNCGLSDDRSINDPGSGVMAILLKRAKEWLWSEDGATATEYAVAVTLIALSIVVSARVFEDALSAKFSELGDQVSDMGTS